MSILVITTMTGTFSARAMPRCSLANMSIEYTNVKRKVPHLLMPMRPLFAATMSRQ